ncbi:hypothetical protein ABT282_36935 [Streptomyces sp. NPDC000927]|uniref:hypothetical protein n=1 Tax=Streptomyces sp. NPDC000927 TaxID=3154371 RepID=UPI0033309ADB
MSHTKDFPRRTSWPRWSSAPVGPPHRGEALDCFAAALNRRDTAGFRRGLHRMLAAEPRTDRYWQLAAEVMSPPAGPLVPTPWSADNWLRAALREPA